MQKLELLRKYLNKAGRDLSPAQEEQFGLYYDLLVSENENMNLTAITELADVQEKHFLDSVWLGNLTDLSGKHSLADVGTGAGFPGIPLKIMYPDLEVVLIDSRKPLQPTVTATESSTSGRPLILTVPKSTDVGLTVMLTAAQLVTLIIASVNNKKNFFMINIS